METKAFYRIRVLGYIDEKWSQRLGDMKITVDQVDDETVTTLEGDLRDQAAFSGVLNTLYEMHFPVLLVEREETTNENLQSR
jgi:hypothetical protein